MTAPSAPGERPTCESPAVSALMVECASGKATKRSVAVAYAMVIGLWAADPSLDLHPVHAAMRDALRLDDIGLDVVRVQAWAMYDAIVARRAASRPTPAAAETHEDRHG